MRDDGTGPGTDWPPAGGEPREPGAAEPTFAPAHAGTRRHPILALIATAVLVAASLVAGYLLGGVGALGGEVCPNDAKWDLDGSAPSASADSVEPKGPELSENEAGEYYLNAIEPSIQPFDDALTASFSGDLAATRNAATDAAKALRATANTLRSRTWPESVANAAATIADNYADRARKADYVASSVGPEAGDELTQLDAYRVSEADAYLRGKLGLPEAAAPAIPLEIVRVEDRGIQQGPDISGSSVNKGKRVIAMTVRSHVPGTLTGLNLSFRLRNGKSAVGRVWGIVHDIALAEGQSIVVPIPLDADDVPSGDTAPGGALAGSRLIWDGLSLTDARGADHKAAVDASYAASNPDPVLDAFVLR